MRCLGPKGTIDVILPLSEPKVDAFYHLKAQWVQARRSIILIEIVHQQKFGFVVEPIVMKLRQPYKLEKTFDTFLKALWPPYYWDPPLKFMPGTPSNKWCSFCGCSAAKRKAGSNFWNRRDNFFWRYFKFMRLTFKYFSSPFGDHHWFFLMYCRTRSGIRTSDEFIACKDFLVA